MSERANSVRRYAPSAAAVIILATFLASCAMFGGRETPSPTAKPVTALCDARSPIPNEERTRLCSMLAALHEPRLPDARKHSSAIYRVVFLQPSRDPLALRIEQTGASIMLTAHRLKNDRLNLDLKTGISAEDLASYKAMVEKTDLWSQAFISDAPTLVACKEPSIIVAEVQERDRYHVSISHCVAMKPLEDFATGTFDFAAARFPVLSENLEKTLD